ncbi:MAG: DUF3006 domain-containing protein [Clostridia bacterium]|nr:DUF3006 domain-containing protein [Clostridia bacterium]
MIVTIDRFEGDFAVVETDNRKIFLISKELVLNAHEGDVVSIEIMDKETKRRKEEISKLADELFK